MGNSVLKVVQGVVSICPGDAMTAGGGQLAHDVLTKCTTVNRARVF